MCTDSGLVGCLCKMYLSLWYLFSIWDEFAPNALQVEHIHQKGNFTLRFFRHTNDEIAQVGAHS